LTVTRPTGGVVHGAGIDCGAVFTPADTTLYATATASVNLVVNALARTTPTLAWAMPAPIVEGTALSATSSVRSLIEWPSHSWRVELFFTWVEQHLRITAFYATSENAVKTQMWIALSVYVLVAIVRKRLALDVTLPTPTSSERDTFRENAHFSCVFRCRPQFRRSRCL